MTVTVDITCGRPDPATTGAFFRSGSYGLGLALYSSLCRRVDPFFPDGSQFDRVRHPGIGMQVTLGRPLVAIEASLSREADLPGDTLDRHASLVFLDEAASRRREAVTAAVRRLATAAAATHGRCLVLPILLYEGWPPHVADLAGIDLSATRERDLVSHLRAHVLARMGTWLATGPGSSGPARSLSIHVRRASGEYLGEGVCRELAGAVDTLGTTAHCRVDGSARELADLDPDPATSVVLTVDTDGRWREEDERHVRRRGLVAMTVRGAGVDLEPPDLRGGVGPSLVWRDGRAPEVLERCLVAWVHHLHFQAVVPDWLAQANIAEPPVVLSRPPALADFAAGLADDGRALIVYPDPPMSRAQAATLAGPHPRARMVTPTTLFAGTLSASEDPAPPLLGREIMLSMAAGPHAPPALQGVSREGFNDLHLRDAIAQVTLALVRSGASLAYGGRLDRRGATAFLAETIARHNELGVGQAPSPVIFGHLTSPPGLEVRVAPCEPQVATGDGKADLAVMYSTKRVRMAERCDACVALGGMTKGYVGRFPGVLEECWHMLEADKPIYVVGGFDGAARLVARALQGTLPADWVRREDARLMAVNRPLVDDYQARWLDSGQRGPRSLAELVADLGERGRGLGPAVGDDVPWINGLTAGENRRLFVTRDPQEIASLVMRGLTATLPRLARAGAGPALHVLEGLVADAERVAAYAVSVIDGGMSDACKELDLRLGGALSLALHTNPDREVVEVPVTTRWALLEGQRVYVVRLWSAGCRLDGAREVRRAVSALVKAADGQLSTLATELFGMTAGVGVADSLTAMRAALGAAAGLLAVTYCEPDAERFADLEATARHAARDGEVVLLPRQTTAAAGAPAGTAPVRASAEIKMQSDETAGASAAGAPAAGAPGARGRVLTLDVDAPADAASAIVQRHSHRLAKDEFPWLADLYFGHGCKKPDDLVEAGRQLGRSTSGIRDQLLAFPGRCLELRVDDTCSWVPWELMRFAHPSAPDPARGQDELVPASRVGLQRQLVVDGRSALPVRRIAGPRKLAVLLVIDPTGNTEGAQAEAEAIEATLARHEATLEVVRLDRGAVTVDELLARLRERRWDVFHYAGHSRFSLAEPKESGLWLADRYLTAKDVDGQVGWPSLVVLNSCRSAAVDRPCTPVGPSLTRNILLAGVRAYVGTQWSVVEHLTSTFTISFYDRLVVGDTVGDAMRAARRALGDEQAYYVLYGDGSLRL